MAAMAGLALAVRPWVGAGVEDTEIVLGALIVGLRRDAVARGQGVPRER